MYLHVSVIYRCRCLCGNHYILTALIFAIVDALFQSNVSVTCFSLNLQMLFSPPVMYKLHLHLAFSSTWGYFLHKFCIYIPHFLWPEDASHWNYASSISENPLSQISSFYILYVLFSSWRPPSKKRLCTPAGASSGKPDSNSPECIVFSCLEVYHDWNK